MNQHNKQEYPPMHTAEHIVNRAMINLMGSGRAVEAHIERKKSKLDYALAAAPTAQQVADLETEVNRVIVQNLPVSTEFVTQVEAAERFDLGRLPSDASDTVRIVRIGNYDECLCIGAHVNTTSEIGHFRILSHSWDEEKCIWRMRFKLE